WRSCLQSLSQAEGGLRDSLLDNRLRIILSASEPLTCDIPRGWAQDLKHPARVINMFGQTETTGIASTFAIPRVPGDRSQLVPIGRTIPNERVYLLDSRLCLDSIGARAEIFIDGCVYDRGYINLRMLAGNRIIPHTFDADLRT